MRQIKVMNIAAVDLTEINRKAREIKLSVTELLKWSKIANF